MIYYLRAGLTPATGFGPTLPLPPAAPDGGYRGISCRPGPDVAT
jgi:hypothetical protein